MRVLTIGFGFFVIVTTSMYTASLAAFMTQERLQEIAQRMSALRLRPCLV